MDEKQVLETLKKLRENSKKRNFVQSIDFSIIIKEVDLEKPEGKIDLFVQLPADNGTKNRVCALVDKELTTQAREVFDKVISKDEFGHWKGKNRELRKLAKEYEYFVAQATIMTDIAATFGKVLGVKGKMPNPKAGCVVPPKVNLAPLKEKLVHTIRLQTKKQPVLSATVGKESTSDENIIKNVMAVYGAIKAALPRGDQQMKRIMLKTTMGKPMVVGA